MMRTNRLQASLIESILLILFAILTTVVVLTGILPGLRPALVFLFLLVAPGLAYVKLLPIDEGFTRLTVAMALSMAIDAVVAMIFLYTGGWAYQPIFLIIAAITVFGAVLQGRSEINPMVGGEDRL